MLKNIVPVTRDLNLAAKDLRYLLSHNYPRERVLTLVGDRYNLNSRDRHILRRGVFAPTQAKQRKKRLLAYEDINQSPLAIDGHNVIITLQTALKGGRLILADDGVIRDIAGIGKSHKPIDLTYQAVKIILVSCIQAARIDIWLDSPISKSGELAGKINNMLLEHGLKGNAEAVPVPENKLYHYKGVVCTSDSVILDQVEKPFDLAGAIIRQPQRALKNQATLKPLLHNLEDAAIESFLADD